MFGFLFASILTGGAAKLANSQEDVQHDGKNYTGYAQKSAVTGMRDGEGDGEASKADTMPTVFDEDTVQVTHADIRRVVEHVPPEDFAVKMATLGGGDGTINTGITAEAAIDNMGDEDMDEYIQQAKELYPDAFAHVYMQDSTHHESSLIDEQIPYVVDVLEQTTDLHNLNDMILSTLGRITDGKGHDLSATDAKVLRVVAKTLAKKEYDDPMVQQLARNFSQIATKIQAHQPEQVSAEGDDVASFLEARSRISSSLTKAELRTLQHVHHEMQALCSGACIAAGIAAAASFAAVTAKKVAGAKILGTTVGSLVGGTVVVGGATSFAVNQIPGLTGGGGGASRSQTEENCMNYPYQTGGANGYYKRRFELGCQTHSRGYRNCISECNRDRNSAARAACRNGCDFARCSPNTVWRDRRGCDTCFPLWKEPRNDWDTPDLSSSGACNR